MGLVVVKIGFLLEKNFYVKAESMKILYILASSKYTAGQCDFRSENTLKVLAKLSEVHTLSCSTIFPTFLLKKIWSTDAKSIVNYAKKKGIKIIWFEAGHDAYSLIKQVRALGPHLRLVCDASSVRSRTLFRELPFSGHNAKNKKLIAEVIKREQEEKSLVALCDVITASSATDVIYYRHLTDQKEKVTLCSEVVDPDYYRKTQNTLRYLKKPAVAIPGSGDNRNWSLKWVLEGVLPLLKKTIPKIHCYIQWEECKKTVEAEGFTFIENTNLMFSYLKSCDVAVIPMHADMGNRFAILQAASCRVPIVMTTVAAALLPFKANEHILIADTCEDFSAAITKLIEDKSFARQIADNACHLVKEEFGLARLEQEVQEIFARIT
jgi:polysaccharide biosynthesis protein PslH